MKRLLQPERDHHTEVLRCGFAFVTDSEPPSKTESYIAVDFVKVNIKKGGRPYKEQVLIRPSVVEVFLLVHGYDKEIRSDLKALTNAFNEVIGEIERNWGIWISS